MINFPYRKATRTHIVRDCLAQLVAGLLLGAILFYSMT